jgi:hypothetical protein
VTIGSDAESVGHLVGVPVAMPGVEVQVLFGADDLIAEDGGVIT